jgi:hypothetical protein
LIEVDPRPRDHTHPACGEVAACWPPAVLSLSARPCQEVAPDELMGTRILVVYTEVGGRDAP